MIQSLPYQQDLVDLSLFEAPVSDESRFSGSSISDLKPRPRIEISSCDGEPSSYNSNELPLSAACLGGPMEFDYQLASYYQSSMEQESGGGTQGGFMARFKRNNRRARTRENSRNRTTQTTDYLPSPSQAFTRSASDPCLNSKASGRLVWCPERESWLYNYEPSTDLRRPATSNGNGREGVQATPNSFLTEYYNDELAADDPPPPYENHHADSKANNARVESQWSRIAQRVCRSPR